MTNEDHAFISFAHKGQHTINENLIRRVAALEARLDLLVGRTQDAHCPHLVPTRGPSGREATYYTCECRGGH